jgi:predicted RNA binding protein YcfA (HicA-like mRNA interferase family)
VKRNLSSRDVLRALSSDGWYHIATEGDHWQFKHPTKLGKVTVPHPKKSLGPKTIRSILKQAGLTPEEFEKCLK